MPNKYLILNKETYSNLCTRFNKGYILNNFLGRLNVSSIIIHLLF